MSSPTPCIRTFFTNLLQIGLLLKSKLFILIEIPLLLLLFCEGLDCSSSFMGIQFNDISLLNYKSVQKRIYWPICLLHSIKNPPWPFGLYFSENFIILLSWINFHQERKMGSGNQGWLFALVVSYETIIMTNDLFFSYAMCDVSMRRYRLQVMLRPVVMWYTRNEIHISLPKLVNLCELATLRHHPYFLSNSFESTKLKITLHIEHALNNYCYAALPFLRLRNNVYLLFLFVLGHLSS